MVDRNSQSSIKSLDPLEVIADCAALQLDPRNADSGDFLSSLSAAAQRQATGTDAPNWKTLASEINRFHDGVRWDPHETVWVESLAFIGGPFLLFTDGNPETVFGLRQILQAIYMGDGVGDEECERHLLDICLVVLRLSDHLAKAAGAKRYAKAGYRSDEGVVLPAADKFEKLRSAVSFSAAELEEVTGKDLEHLAPVTRDLDVDGPIPYSDQTGAPQTERFPLVKCGDRYVVASPASLSAALRHRLLVELINAGERDQLRRRLWQTALAGTIAAGGRMGWQLAGTKSPEDEQNIGQAAFAFDDKMAIITMVIDDLADYKAEVADSMWNAFPLGDDIERAMLDAEEAALFGPPPRPSDILHIAVLAGVGRSVMFGLGDQAEPLDAPRLVLSLEALTTISYAGVDSLELWKFAKAGARLRAESEVSFTGPIDEYAAWRDMQRTFYFGDERRPTLVHFDPSYGRSFREKVGIERDLHGAARSGAITEVTRLADDPEIPVYIPARDLYDRSDEVPRLLVEHGEIPLWVRAIASAGQDDLPAYAKVVDCIAFWLWQVSPAFPPLPQGPIDIEVLLETPEAWRSASRAPDENGRVAEVQIVGPSHLQVTVFARIVSRLDHPDNDGERELAASLLKGISDLVAATGAQALDNEQIAAAIDRHAPLGPKKKINLLTGINEAALLDGPMPSPRYIQDPDPEPFLDEAGRFVAEKLRLPVGPIADERRGEVLNAIVAHHLEELQAIIATLSADGLLESLIDAHEALLHRQAVSRITYPAEVAAYGEGERLDRLREEIPRSANAGVALRFLIEYVAACPPHGIRLLSLDLFDQLLALASQIANRGWTSDIVQYKLAQRLGLSILESGRLGINRDETYFSGQEAYLDARVPSVAQIAQSAYRSHWGERKEVSEDLLDRFDVAADAEWGISMRELGQIYGELGNAAHRRRMAAVSAPRSGLIAELCRELGFAEETVECGVQLLTLVPRDDFLSPPPPFKLPDIYPWRFNRELSYLRRPLILRETDSEPEIVWGFRHVEAAGHYLLDLVNSERLKARSNEMKALMTELRQKETAAFVDEVARRLEEAGMVVDKNVKKIRGKQITRPNEKDEAGDLDILAADPKRKVLHVRECKDLEGARTPVELSNELRHNFAVDGEKRSAADRHLLRTSWVERHLDETLAHLGIEPEKDWHVVGGFVVDVEVLSPYVSECPLPITPIDRLEEVREVQ